jgi:predicted RNA-binding Zn-ribbon protein involved in translation (DUF1610 family)
MAEGHLAPPTCIACNRERLLVSAEPVRAKYEIGNFKCPGCGSILRLVQKQRKRRSKPAPRMWVRVPKT